MRSGIAIVLKGLVLAMLALLGPDARSGQGTAGPCTVSMLAFAGDGGERFGWSVGIHGDLLVAGAPGAREAHVYRKKDGLWVPVAVLVPDGAQEPSGFGLGVAIWRTTIAVSNQNEIVGGALNAGAVYVFEEVDGEWVQVARLTALAPHANEVLEAVAIHEDVIVGGAGGRNGEGAVYVFEKPAGGWADMSAQTATLTARTGIAGGRLGISVAVSGPVILAGADASGTGDMGRAYVFQRSGAQWTDANEDQLLVASDGTPGNRFGLRVAIDGATAVVAASFEEGGAADSGAAYVYEFDPIGNTWEERAKLAAEDPQANDRIGAVGVWNGTVVLGSSRPAYYRFEKPSAGWVDATAPSLVPGTLPDGTTLSVAVHEKNAVFGTIQANQAFVLECPGRPPVADPGGPYAAECEGDTTIVRLD